MEGITELEPCGLGYKGESFTELRGSTGLGVEGL